ncbi:MAG: hypothetical protein BHW35_03565 [Firmicutes bacterium CAG:176_63_11]|nr:MAG: hypothetical protein BHW35_03565 [Firmicutes bacterium CAG:176_63_11]
MRGGADKSFVKIGSLIIRFFLVGHDAAKPFGAAFPAIVLYVKGIAEAVQHLVAQRIQLHQRPLAFHAETAVA